MRLRLPLGRAAPPVKGRRMNSIVQGPLQVEIPACRRALAPFRWGGPSATAQQPDAVFELAVFGGRAVTHSKKTTNCISDKFILQAKSAGMELDSKGARNTLPIQLGMHISRPDGGQAAASSIVSAYGSRYLLSDSAPGPFTHSEDALPTNDAAPTVAEIEVMSASTSLTGFTNLQDGGIPTAATLNSVHDVADHCLIWQNGESIPTVLALTMIENIPEDTNNDNSIGKAVSVSTVILMPRFDDQGSTERNICPAEGNSHHTESNHQTNCTYCSDPSDNSTLEAQDHWLNSQPPVPTYLITEMQGCTDPESVVDPDLAVAKVVRSRSAKRNDRRSCARYRAQQRLRTEKKAARQRCRQYEQDLALARCLQAALVLEAGSLDSTEERSLDTRRKDQVAGHHQRKQLKRDSSQCSRRTAQLRRLRGRTVKRQLATLARTMRNLFLDEHTQLPLMSSCTSTCRSVPGEQLPSSSCVGILDWWSRELREHLAAELEVMTADCLKQQAPQQPNPPVILLGIYDQGDQASIVALTLLSSLQNDHLESSAQNSALHAIFPLTHDVCQTMLEDASGSAKLFPVVGSKRYLSSRTRSAQNICIGVGPWK